METTIHAYTAGIIDGEGTITLTRASAKTHRRPNVSVSSTTYELLLFLKSHYGGTIVKHKIYQDHHKPHWSWRIEYDRALSALKLITPYLLVPEKAYRAKLLLERYKLVTPRNGKYTEELLLKKAEFENDFFHPSIP